MKRVLFIFPLIAALGIGLFSVWGLTGDRNPSDIPSALLGKPIPNFKIETIMTEGISELSNNYLANLEKITVVNFFASWCLPCKAEHSSLKKLKSSYDIHLAGISYKDKRNDTSNWLSELGNPYHVVGLDMSGRTGIEWGISGVPETFLINKKGEIIYKFAGPLLGENLVHFENLLMLELNKEK
jgi:cytochrome c biogenesis protein CcmG/thiol:disulfide interchange protein DsbE